MTLRQRLEQRDCPDVRMAAAILLLGYRNAGLTVNLTHEDTLKELSRLAELSDDDFEKEHQISVKARHQ